MNFRVIGFALCVLAVSGCTVSFQPFPSVTQKEFKTSIEQLLNNDKILAEGMAKIRKEK